jgi:hypothetical protein
VEPKPIDSALGAVVKRATSCTSTFVFRIVGAILIARQQDAPLVTAAVKDGRNVSALLAELERGDWDALGEEPRELAAVE